MLRRRFLLLISGGYRWLKAIFKVFLHRKAKAESADAVEISADDETQTIVKGSLLDQPISDVNVDVTAVNESDVPLASADAEEVIVKRSAFAKLKAGFVAYIIGKINFAKAIVTKLFAKVSSVIGELFSASAKNLTKQSATVGYAGTTEAETSDTSATSTDLTVSLAETTEATAIDTTESASNGKVVYWIEPVFENGTLTIRSVYNALQTDEILEVM